MESRITLRTEEFLEVLDQRIADALRKSGKALDAEVIDAIHQSFRLSIDDVIALARKGRDVHERFVQHTVMHSVDAIVGADPMGRIFFWNHGAEHLFGYTAEEALTQSCAMLFPDDPPSSVSLEGSRFAIPLPSGTVLHLPLVAKGGRRCDVSLSREPILTEDGEDLGSVIIIHDLTEVRMLERRLARNEKLALLGQIAAGIAHELGTPLNIIRGAAELLLLDRPMDHPDAADLRTILRQTSKITTNISDLLVFARPAEPCMVRVDVAELLEQTAGLMAKALDKAGVRIQVLAEKDLPLAFADIDLLQQVFMNLIVNARDAFEGTMIENPRITIHAREIDSSAGPRVLIRCEDNGPGILPEHIPHVFEPFFSTKVKGKGTGLGLALCRGFLEQMQGEIEVEMGRSEGAGFQVFLSVSDSKDSA